MNVRKSPGSVIINLFAAVAFGLLLTIALITGLGLTVNLVQAKTVEDGGWKPKTRPNQIGIAGCPTIPSISFLPANPNPAEQVEFTGAISSPDGTGQITYTWNFGDGSNPKPGWPSTHHTYLLNNIYTVTMTATGDSCVSPEVATTTITIGFGPPAATYYFPIIYGGSIFNVEIPDNQPSPDAAGRLVTPKPVNRQKQNRGSF